jgi:hypothetical protein
MGQPEMQQESWSFLLFQTAGLVETSPIWPPRSS